MWTLYFSEYKTFIWKQSISDDGLLSELSPVSIQKQSLALRALRLDGNRAKRKRLRFKSKRNARNASDCVWMETGLYDAYIGVALFDEEVHETLVVFVFYRRRVKVQMPRET